MTKAMIVFIAAIALSGCGPSQEERHAAFIRDCVPAFSRAQCEVLFGVKEEARQAKAAANSASFSSGVAIGMAATR